MKFPFDPKPKIGHLILPLQRLNIHPGALGPRFQALLRQLDTLRPGEQRPWKRLAVNDVLQKHLPLALERVVITRLLGHLLPAFEEVQRLLDVGVPHRARSAAIRLDPAMPQPNDGGAVGAVDLHGEQVVAANANGPGGVEVRDHSAFQLESRVGAVVGGAFVWAALFVPTLRDVDGAQAEDGIARSEETVLDVASVAQQVNDLGELDPETEIVVHCIGGGRSAKAQGILHEAGFKNVINMKSGILAWSGEVLDWTSSTGRRCTARRLLTDSAANQITRGT